MELDKKGTVYSYNNDQYRRTAFDVEAGDRLEWKRNGSRGSVNAKVIGFSDSRPDKVCIQNYLPDWRATYGFKVWISKRSVLRVITNN